MHLPSLLCILGLACHLGRAGKGAPSTESGDPESGDPESGDPESGDPDSPWPGTLTGADATAWWVGAQPGEELGLALSAGGDLDGDGHGDVLLGAPGWGDSRGRACISLGPAQGEQPLGEGCVEGVAAGTRLGRTVALSGDLDQDGREDAVVGGPGPNEEGAVFLLSHDPGEVTLGEVVAFEGSPGLGSGLRARGPGDVDGDGLPDLLLGSPRAAPGGTVDAGQVGVFFGPLSGSLSLASPAGALLGTEGGAFTGGALESAGDIDGDGMIDLVVGAWGAGTVYQGAVHLVMGPLPRSNLLVDDVDHTIHGEVEWDMLGYAVAGAGDLDGDGLDDLVLGAYGADIQALGDGAAWVLAGPAEEDSLDGAVARISGDGEGDGLGWALAGLGDTDGDGKSDIALGSPRADGGSLDEGLVAIFSGPVQGALLAADADARVLGGERGAEAGYSVGAGGDVDADGLQDLLFAAPSAGAGTVWLFSGPGT